MSEAVAEEEQARRGHRLDDAMNVARCRPKGLAICLALERVYDPDREAMIAALRVALGLPRALPSRQEGLR